MEWKAEYNGEPFVIEIVALSFALQNPVIPNIPLLFDNICHDIAEKGYSIQPGALSLEMANRLASQAISLHEGQMVEAGIGRGDNYVKSEVIRKDEIAWINRGQPEVDSWLDWTENLRQTINQTLFMGLFSFESHFAHYPPGGFYRKHVDAFKGEKNRVLSVVAYLNSSWLPEEGGELVLYTSDTSINVTPLMGTVAVFLSEDVPHEVLKTNRDRYSIAGWFRVNNSINNMIDPPV